MWTTNPILDEIYGTGQKRLIDHSEDERANVEATRKRALASGRRRSEYTH